MAILLLQLIFADDVADLLADLPPSPIDLPIELNGNLLLQLIVADEVADLLADLLYHPVDWPMDLNGNSTLSAHIGRWSGTSAGRSIHPKICQWIWIAVLLIEVILADEVADLTQSPLNVPMDLNGNSICLSSYWQMKCQIYWQIFPTLL